MFPFRFGRLGRSDDSAATGQLGLVVALVVLYFISGVFAWDEIRNSLWGKVTTATVESAGLVTERTRRTTLGGQHRRQLLRIEYQFRDDQGKVHRREAHFDPQTKIARGDQLPAIFVPGDVYSGSLVRQRRWWSLWVLGGMSGVMLAGVAALFLWARGEVEAMERKDRMFEAQRNAGPGPRRRS